VSRPGRSLPPRERPGTHCTGGWVGRRASLDRCGKSRPHRDSIPRPQFGIWVPTVWWKPVPPSSEWKSVLRMKAAGFSKMFAPTYQTTWHYIPQDTNNHIKCVTIYWYMPIKVNGMPLGNGANLPLVQVKTDIVTSLHKSLVQIHKTCNIPAAIRHLSTLPSLEQLSTVDIH